MDTISNESNLSMMVKRHRLRLHYSQGTIARLCEVTPKAIRDIEQGKLVPTQKVILNLSKYLELDYRQLILAAVMSELELPSEDEQKLVSYVKGLKLANRFVGCSLIGWFLVSIVDNLCF